MSTKRTCVRMGRSIDAWAVAFAGMMMSKEPTIIEIEMNEPEDILRRRLLHEPDLHLRTLRGQSAGLPDGA